MRLTLAAAQLRSGPDPAANLATAVTVIGEAARAGASLVVLPEGTMACFGTPLGPVAEPLTGPFASGIRAAAARHGILVVVGMFTPAPDGRVHNTLLITDGLLDAAYHKIHLFDAFGSLESRTVAPGSELVTVPALGTVIGVATCYDLRFADQFTALGRAGAEVICVPASWAEGSGKAEQWDLLTRARAMDAQAWLVASGQAWTAPRGRAPLGIGRSVVAGPTGAVRARLDGEPGLLVTTVDLDEVAATRARIPLLS